MNYIYSHYNKALPSVSDPCLGFKDCKGSLNVVFVELADAGKTGKPW